MLQLIYHYLLLQTPELVTVSSAVAAFTVVDQAATNDYFNI